VPFVYLGYWVEGSARMQYKTRFQPIERLGPTGWQRFSPPAPAATPRTGVSAGVDPKGVSITR
jgi:arginyl-tRNA--protein-N-Asp/Glu arginylyltransferase